MWVHTGQDTSALRDLAPPTPAPAPQIITIEHTCYSTTLNVLNKRGYPIGVATGRSCESQAAADANAQAEADRIKEHNP